MAQDYTRSDADKLKDFLETKESGVPMYYAVTGK
jgi:protease-4